MSTPQPSLQTPFPSGSNKHEDVPKVNVVYSGEGNLLSQTISQKETAGQSQPIVNVHSNKPINTGAVHSGETHSIVQNIQQKGSQTAPSQIDQKQTVPFTANRFSGDQKTVTTLGTSIGSSSSAQTTQSIPSTQSFGQRDQSNAHLSTVTQFSAPDQTTIYNNRVSFGQKLSTIPSGTTAVPYSPSVPPFRSTTTTTYTPTATSYNQHTQTYNGQSHQSRSYTQHDNVQSSFSNNQFQVPSKEYLPSADNTRTARTNEQSFGNHGSSTLKLSSSQNFARNGGNQQDSRQQFTYPVDQVIN